MSPPLTVSNVITVSPTPISPNKPIDFDVTAGSSKVFSFTATSTALHNIYTDYYAGTSTSGASDTILYVYSDTAMTSLVAFNDDFNGSVHARLAVTL